ncbi:MAG TPA: DNA recombination/repair protein RecA, partial [Dehalococcoidia bacterium]|nr:DNA recombination/repair protein RecA [Dehalococcoidia bacterium]
ISREGDIIDLGAEYNVIKKQGSFYSYGELRLGQGRENARAYLVENPALAAQIEAEIRAAASQAHLVSLSASRNGASPIASDEDDALEDEA